MRHPIRAALATAALLAAVGSASAATMQRHPTSARGPSVQTNHAPATDVVTGGCGGQLLLDPGLEATDGTFNNPNWSSASTNFTTALCTVAGCGGGASHAGDFFAWFGGTTNDEVATLGQTLTLPTPGPRYLNFFMSMASGDAPYNDVLLVKVDGTTVRTFNEPVTGDGGAYVQRSVDISTYVDGNSHAISFEYSHTDDTSALGWNAFVDDITIDCAQLPVTLQNYRVD